jgi:hypothetical protein
MDMGAISQEEPAGSWSVWIEQPDDFLDSPDVIWNASGGGVKTPEVGEFWQKGFLELPAAPNDVVILEGFRADPAGSPLRTPSGRIEIFPVIIGYFG